jgi:hypothetical protein
VDVSEVWSCTLIPNAFTNRLATTEVAYPSSKALSLLLAILAVNNTFASQIRTELGITVRMQEYSTHSTSSNPNSDTLEDRVSYLVQI